MVELAIEDLDRREWPRSEAEIKVARALLSAAQTLARGLIADGREQEVRENREFISGIVPDPDDNGPAENTTATQAHSTDSIPR